MKITLSFLYSLLIRFTKIKFVVLYLLVIGFQLLLMTISIRLWAYGSPGWSIVGAATLALEIIWICFSFGQVDADEVAGMFLFGAPLGDIGHGLYYAPKGIIKVRKFSGTHNQEELPGEPDKIFRDEDKMPVPAGMVPPNRVKFGQPDPSDPEHAILKDDPYHKAMVVEVVTIVDWKIKSATAFFKHFGTVENCRKILNDKAFAVYGDEFSRITPAKALRRLGETSQRIENSLRKEVSREIGPTKKREDTGISLTDAYVKPFGFSHTLNKAVVGVSIAEQTKLTTMRTAEGENYKRTQEGIGTAAAMQALLDARAIGLKKIADALGITEGFLILQMEMAQKAMENADYSIVPGDSFYPLFAGLKETMDKIKTTPKP